MWQRFSENARRVVFYAQEEAGRLDDNNVNDGHMFLGLLRVTGCGGLKLLAGSGVEVGSLEEAVKQKLSTGSGRLTQDMGLTPRGKRIIDLAYGEARNLGHKHIGTEHLVLGMLREGEDPEGGGPAGVTLAGAGGSLENARAVLLLLISAGEITLPDAPSDQQGQPDTNPMPADEAASDPSTLRGQWQRFTERARKVIFYAQEEAIKHGDNTVTPEYLLLGLLREEDNVAGRILALLSVPPLQVIHDLNEQLPIKTGGAGRDLQLTQDAKKVVDSAYDESTLLNNNYIGTDHILLALVLNTDFLAGRILAGYGLDIEGVRAEVRWLQAGDPGTPPQA